LVFGPAQKMTHRASLRRRQQVEERLAAAGLARAPRRLFRGAQARAHEGAPLRELRAALESLGPVFSAFGLYVSTRVDLLPVSGCTELAAIPDRAAATPFASVREIISSGIGRPPEEVYLAFEEEPFESGLLFQSHRARLFSGRAATVKVMHPEVEEYLTYDIGLLPLLKSALAWSGCAEPAVESAMADFHRALRRRLDFGHDAASLEALAEDATEFETFRVPQLQRHLCASKVLTIEHLPGLSLDALLSTLGDSEIGAPPDARREGGRIKGGRELARLLCCTWLRQAFLGRLFPVEPRPADILILPGGQIAYTGGLCDRLPSESQANLLEYLFAVTGEDPDRACSCLLREMKEAAPPGGDAELRQAFRRVVPFRESGWGDCAHDRGLAAYLFAHWRLMSERGYLPRHYLPPFYRSMFLVSRLARRLAPDCDPLTEGVSEVGLLAGIAEFREMMSLGQLGDQMDKYAAMMVDLPRRFDDALTFAAEGRGRPRSQAAGAGRRHRRKNSSVVVVALLSLLAALSLLAHRLALNAVAGQRLNQAGAVAFLLLGALLLKNVSRAP
jgi:ubiquinone biosynthesis protein